MKVMLLIDADNVTADVVEQALERVLEMHGAAHIRRAYCTAEAAAKQLKLFKKWSIRPMVNIASGKNCTDIALSIDAVDLAIAERPDVAVIVSSDSDFAPLVLKLREKGCRVEGIGQEGKTSDDTKPVYDLFVDLPHRKGRAAGKTAARAPARTGTTRGRARATAPAEPLPAPVPEPSPPPAPAAKKTRGRRSAAKPAAPAAAPLPEEVEAILGAMPALREGAWVELREAAAPLRAAGLLSRAAASTKVFRKHPARFELQPPDQPAKVRFLAP
jgi:uncharacterized LabA/DUF88 family protein